MPRLKTGTRVEYAKWTYLGQAGVSPPRLHPP